jgi:Ca2+-binding RTX toxin-like protein
LEAHRLGRLAVGTGGKNSAWLLAAFLVPSVGTLTVRDPELGSCSYDGASHAVTAQADPADAESAFYELKVVDGRILFQGGTCGEATVTNTDTIHFTGLSPDDVIYEEYFDLYLPFAPGFTLEPDGLPEIEVVLNFPADFACLDVYGTDRANQIVVGALGYNTNGDNDVDITVRGVRCGDVEGRRGADFISAGGGRGTDGSAVIGLNLYGEEGPDRVIDGARSAAVLSGGSGKDVVRGGGGKDRLDTFAAFGRDKLFGGSGRDYCFAVPGKDRTKSCERVLPPE